MRNKNMILLALLCMSAMVTRVHAAAIVECKDEEIKIYERRSYVPEAVGIGLSLVGLERGRWFFRMLSVSGMIASLSSLAMKAAAGWKGDLVLTLSPKGIHYIGSPLIPWESIQEVATTRYKTSLGNSFEFAITTQDNLFVVIDSARVDVEFNWLYEQIYKFHLKDVGVETINIQEDDSVQVGQ